MSQRVSIIVAAFVLSAILGGCGRNNPHQRGIEAGRAACECYKIDDAVEREACLDKIDSIYHDMLGDTAFTNAVEEVTIKCLTEGVNDIVKPINHHNTPAQTNRAQSDTTK